MRGALSPSELLRVPRRVALLAVTAGAILVALTGCVRYDIAAELHPDDTLSGTFVLALKQYNVVQLYGSEQKFLDMLRTELENSSGNGGTNGIVPARPHRGAVNLRVYRSGEFVGYQQRFTGIPITELNPEALTVRHRDSRFIVDIKVDFLNTDAFAQPTPDGGRPAPAEPKSSSALQKDLKNQLQAQGVNPALVFGKDAPEVKVRLTFPGEIISSNGEVAGRSVTWQLVLGKQRVLHASGWDSPAHSLWWLYLILVVLAAGPAFLLARWSLRGYLRWWSHGKRGPLAPEPEKPVLGFEGLPSLGGPPVDAHSSITSAEPSQGRGDAHNRPNP